VQAALLALTLVGASFGKGSSGVHYGSHSSSLSSTHSNSLSEHHNKNYAEGVPRDSHGRIERSEKAKDDFKHSHPCPSTGKSSGSCPGYAIDHVIPLKRGAPTIPRTCSARQRPTRKRRTRSNSHRATVQLKRFRLPTIPELSPTRIAAR
jgi:hypothetical protein